MRQLGLSGFALYASESLPPEPDPDPNAAIIDGTLAQALNNDFIARQQELLQFGFGQMISPSPTGSSSGSDGLLTALRGRGFSIYESGSAARQRSHVHGQHVKLDLARV